MTDQLHQPIVTTPHRATPLQWRLVEEDDAQAPSCILELRARVEALEAAQHEQAESHRFCFYAIVRRVEALEAPMTELRAASAEAQPAGGLMERVRRTIRDNAPCSHSNARAAICEVAKWLRENDCGYNAIRWLEQEADR
jgi:hypothetical protein